MKKQFWIPLAMLVLGVLLVGCGGGSGSGGTAGTSTAGIDLTAATSAAKGSLSSISWNLPAGEPASLDYSKTWDTASGNTVLANLCDNLMRQEPDGTIVPALAESVKTPNPTTYVYEIRKGVTFTDGAPMTAQDVAFSLNRQLDPKTASYWAIWFEDVKSVKVTGEYEVTVSLSKPDVIFGEMMSTPAGAVVEQKYVEEKGSAYGTPSGGVMCTGPFSLASWKAGKSIVLKANHNYWDASLRPKVEAVEFTFITDESAIINGLQTGAIEGSWLIPPNGVKQLSSSGAGSVYANPSTRIDYLAMSSFEGSLKNPKIRLALQQAIDYSGIASGILRGYGEPSAAAATSASWGYAKSVFKAGYRELPAAEQNLEHAEELVAQAGGASSAPIVIGYSSADPTATSMVTAIKDSASKIGLKVSLKGLPVSTYGSLFFEPQARAGLDAFYVSSTLDVADPLELYLQVMPSGPYNYTGYDNPGFSGPMTEAAATANQTKRAELITEGQKSAGEQVQMFLPIASPYETVFLKRGVTGVPVSTLSSLYYPWAATLGSS